MNGLVTFDKKSQVQRFTNSERNFSNPSANYATDALKGNIQPSPGQLSEGTSKSFINRYSQYPLNKTW
jgi:hypothetical protein